MKYLKLKKTELFYVIHKAQISKKDRLNGCAKTGNKEGKWVTFVAKRGQQPLDPKMQPSTSENKTQDPPSDDGSVVLGGVVQMAKN